MKRIKNSFLSGYTGVISTRGWREETKAEEISRSHKLIREKSGLIIITGGSGGSVQAGVGTVYIGRIKTI